MATLERQCLDLKTDKLRLLLEIDEMRHDYEQHPVLSCRQSAAAALRGNSL